MKKKSILALLLVACMLLVGCQNDIPEMPTPVTTPHPVTATPELFWEDGRLKMTVTWNNQSPTTIQYGNAYNIQRLDGDKWVSTRYEPNDYATTLEAYIVHPLQTQTKTYWIGACHYLGIPGQYRFVTDYDTESSDGGFESHVVISEFTIDKTFLNQNRRSFEVAFNTRSFPTPVISDYFPNPPATAVYSEKQWDSYILANKATYDLSSLDALRSEYDEAFFKSNYVILVPLVGAKDAVDNEVQQLLGDSLGNHQVMVHRQCQNAGTGIWHIILEVTKPERSNFSRGPYTEIIKQ